MTNAFQEIVTQVTLKSPFQKKKLHNYLSRMDDIFFNDAELFASSYCAYLEHQDIPLDFAVSAYLQMCSEMMKCQVEFMKTGRYAFEEQRRAFDEVYNNSEKMTSYMIALAMSQFLWPTHYQIFRCFSDTIKKYAPVVKSYLEIGPGHGLFLKKGMESLGRDTKIVAVDISPASIAITKSIMEYFQPSATAITYCTEDVLCFNDQKKYDFITMGEVLEHVTCPAALLSKLCTLLDDDGVAFVSTSINSPAIDHVYHYKHVDDVRDMIAAAGLVILDERVLPVEEMPMEEIVTKKITVNYCAVLKRK